MRSTKAQNQSKFIRVITIPLRILCKARDLYVKSMTDCAMNVSYGPAIVLTAGQYYPPMPRSFSVGSSRSNDSEDFRELVRTASARSAGHSSEIELYMEQLREQQSSIKMGSKKGLPKSCSAGMGFMGRIDEDKPCDFEAAGCAVGKPELGPRSRSYAASKRKLFF